MPFSPVPQLPPRYRMEQELGRGGMGVVYRVYDTAEKQQVALKTIQPRYEQNGLVIDQFNREIKLMQRLGGHANIVPVLDKGTLPNGRPYFTMTYVDGHDLKKIIFDTHQTLTLDEIYDLLDQIGSALAYAHGRDIKHRDIKPNNIIKSKDGKFYLTDFGIAVDTNSDTGPQIDAWTEDYAAPEIKHGGVSTLRSDVYSLGMTVLEVCLNCRYAEAKHRTKNHPFSLLENHGTFRHFVPILRKAIEIDPQRRYSSVAEFAGDFADRKRRLERPPTYTVRPPAPPPAMHRHARRAQRADRFAFFFLFVIVTVLLLALLAFFNLQSGLRV